MGKPMAKEYTSIAEIVDEFVEDVKGRPGGAGAVRPNCMSSEACNLIDALRKAKAIKKSDEWPYDTMGQAIESPAQVLLSQFGFKEGTLVENTAGMVMYKIVHITTEGNVMLEEVSMASNKRPFLPRLNYVEYDPFMQYVKDKSYVISTLDEEWATMAKGTSLSWEVAVAKAKVQMALAGMKMDCSKITVRTNPNGVITSKPAKASELLLVPFTTNIGITNDINHDWLVKMGTNLYDEHVVLLPPGDDVVEPFFYVRATPVKEDANLSVKYIDMTLIVAEKMGVYGPGALIKVPCLTNSVDVQEGCELTMFRPTTTCNERSCVSKKQRTE